MASVIVVAGFAPSASADEVYQPQSGNITVLGHGWGHLKGMSQYGTRQAVIEGNTYDTILGFYYPGTGTGDAGGNIRVRLDGGIDSAVEFVAQDGSRVIDTGDGGQLSLQSGQRYRITVDGPGKQRVQRREAGEWVAVPADISGRTRVASDQPFWVAGIPSTSRVRGFVEFVTKPVEGGGNTLWPVNHLSLEHYTYGVVASEMPSSWGVEALKVQAVAARTYAANVRGDGGGDHDICSTTSCQVYRGTIAEADTATQAVDATAGQIRTWEGAPAFTQYSSSNGGWTRAGTVPYQVTKEDGWDKRSDNPHATWNVELTAAQISNAYPSIGDLQRVVVLERDGHGDWGGQVLQLRLEGTGGTHALSGNAFRSKFGLRSNYYTFTSEALCGDGRFHDVPASSQFCSDILWMSDTGLTTGYTDDTYRPAAPVTRQAMGAFIWRYRDEPAISSTEPHFADVDAGHPFFTAIQWMFEAGLSTGTPQDGGKPLYKPSDPVSRQAMGAFLWREEGEPASGTTPHFADVEAAHTFFAAIQWMFESDVSNGTAQSSGPPLFKPADAVSRQAMAAFLHRFDGLPDG